ncbi:inositol-pentakisphosphate 2-kinase [Syncephalis fuscata]|nr:inositol-pentakisphosphate 2-kinase [Syncephalis fuscata]
MTEHSLSQISEYMLSLSKLCASDWKYRAEGNANICFAYSGHDHQLRGTLLRLRKRDVSKETAFQLASNEQSEYDPLLELFYRQTVIAPLLGTEYVGDMRLVSVHTEFLNELAQICNHLRPQSRHGKEIDTSQPYGLLTLDHATFISMDTPTITFELKPKWGFLPKETSEYAQEIHPEKFRACRFCMHQHLKAEKHLMAQSKQANTSVSDWLPSHYCPLDLFSSDRQRVQTALNALIACPQNNLRVWKTVLETDNQSPDKILVVGNTGIGQKDKQQQHSNASNHQDELDRLLETVVDILLHDNHYLLDNPGIEVIMRYYHELLELKQKQAVTNETATRLSCIPSTHNETISIWQNALCSYQQQAASMISNNSHDEELQCLLQLHKYLFSATLKDCTILLTIGSTSSCTQVSDHIFTEHIRSFPPTTSETSMATQPNESGYHYKLSIIDLDIKPLTRITDYHKLDRDILDAYLRSNVRRNCR